LGFVTVDPETRKAKIEPELIASQHLSQFIRPGARQIKAQAAAPVSITFFAALNDDGTHVFVANNRTSATRKFSLKNENGELADVTMPPMSILTLNWK
jgi:O-glycosyl hydrolase